MVGRSGSCSNVSPQRRAAGRHNPREPNLPLSHYEQTVEVPAGWDVSSCGYIYFGPPVRPGRGRARTTRMAGSAHPRGCISTWLSILLLWPTGFRMSLRPSTDSFLGIEPQAFVKNSRRRRSVLQVGALRKAPDSMRADDDRARRHPRDQDINRMNLGGPPCW